MALRRREPRLGRVWSFILFAALAGCVLLPSCNSTQETDTVTEKPGDTKTRTLIATKVPEPTPRPVDIALPTPTAEPENTQERTPVATRIPRPTPKSLDNVSPTPTPGPPPVPTATATATRIVTPESTPVGHPSDERLWLYDTDSSVFSSPAVVDGVVYVGSRDGYVYALDALTGGARWSYETNGEVYSSPAVVEGVVYISSNDGRR